MRYALAALVVVMTWAAPSTPPSASLRTSFSLAAPALAGESACGPRATIMAELGERFGEAVVFRGRHPTSPQVMELLVNPETGTFTVLVSDPETSCVTAAGVDAALHDYVAPPTGDPS
ncbi:MAG: hypothetical protein ACREER_09955 [Alphaproteobacteria bacterium]